MKHIFRTLCLCVAVLCMNSVFAEEEAPAEEKTFTLEDYAAMGPGVYNVKTNEKGEIQTLIVVGTARISMILGESHGIQVARQKAAMICDAEFVKFVKTHMTVAETNNDENICVMKGSNAEEDYSEEEKNSDVLTRKLESFAQGSLRGMVVLYSEVNSESQEYVVVKGFDNRTIAGIKKLGAELESDDPTPAPQKKKKVNRKLKSEKHVAPNAGDFL